MAVQNIEITARDGVPQASGGCACCAPRPDHGERRSDAQTAQPSAGAAGTARTTVQYAVAGMTCGHCSGAVTRELSGLPDVLDVAVDLVPGGASVVTVTSRTPLSRDLVAAAVDAAGYGLATD